MWDEFDYQVCRAEDLRAIELHELDEWLEREAACDD